MCDQDSLVAYNTSEVFYVVKALSSAYKMCLMHRCVIIIIIGVEPQILYIQAQTYAHSSLIESAISM